MAEVTSKICDLCGSPAFTRVTWRQDARATYILDLCDECFEPFLRYKEVGRSEKSKRKYAGFRKQQYVDRATTA